jgi:hypothetical protein
MAFVSNRAKVLQLIFAALRHIINWPRRKIMLAGNSVMVCVSNVTMGAIGSGRLVADGNGGPGLGSPAGSVCGRLGIVNASIWAQGRVEPAGRIRASGVWLSKRLM